MTTAKWEYIHHSNAYTVEVLMSVSTLCHARYSGPVPLEGRRLSQYDSTSHNSCYRHHQIHNDNKNSRFDLCCFIILSSSEVLVDRRNSNCSRRYIRKKRISESESRSSRVTAVRIILYLFLLLKYREREIRKNLDRKNLIFVLLQQETS
jgi:hypothetical protein